MGPFEYGLAGTMAFLVLAVLALIALDAPGFPAGASDADPGPAARPAAAPEPAPEPPAAPAPEPDPEPPAAPPPPAALFGADVSMPAGSALPGCEAEDECYIPSRVTVAAGSSVTWTNDDTAAHTVTSGTPMGGPDGMFDSGLVLAGGEFTAQIAEPGDHPYYCIVHPWMAGSVEAV